MLFFVVGGLPGADEYLAGHDAERAARYADAIQAYSACAAKDGPLAPYALVKTALCRGASGDGAGCAQEFHRIAKDCPKGPWKRMAQVYLASRLAMDKNYAAATKTFDEALSFSPKPWWVDQYDRMAADADIEVPEHAAKGFAYFRNLAATTRLRAPRLEAAERLATSSSAEDKIAAAFAITRSAESRDTLGLILGTAPAGEINWLQLTAALSPKNKDGVSEALRRVRGIAALRPGDPWIKTWLAYLVKGLTSTGDMATAQELCDVLANSFPGADETGDALWWLSNRLAKNSTQETAIEHYIRLADVCPKHRRADEALLAAAELWKSIDRTQDYVKTLRRLAEQYPDYAVSSKASYWAGLELEKAGDKQQASELFRRALRRGPGDFYAHRALARLHRANDETAKGGSEVHTGGPKSFLRTFPQVEMPGDLPTDLLEDVRYQRLFFFGEHGFEEAEWEALALAPDLEKENMALVYQALGEAGVACTAMNYAESFKWGLKDGHYTTERRRVMFPRAYWPHVLKIARETGVDPYLILAVARQESTFRPALTSSAGAQGVMQLMPNTAKHLANTDPAITQDRVRDLEAPLNSLVLGAHYLKHMIERCDGNIAYALASYNAGPSNCAKWRAQFPNKDLETFIEAIPFAETRDYVKTVLANYAAYYSLYPAPK